MKIPLWALVFQGIPEQIAVITLAFVLAKVPIRWKVIIPMGIGFACTAYILRLLPITFGVHTIVFIGLLFILLIWFYKKPISASILASLITYLALILFETAFMSIFMFLLQISLQTLEANVSIRILTGLPHVIGLFLLARIIHKIRAGRGIK